jgi:hypothetical protein
MRGWVQDVIGAAEIVGGIILEMVPGGQLFGSWLIAAGIGTVMSGIGTLLAGQQVNGYATTVRNPTAPWRYCYGLCRVGGTMVYCNLWPQPGGGAGGNDQMLDIVVVLAAHVCESVDVVLFDQQRVQIDATACPAGALPGSGTSFTPLQETNITISSISRSNNVVTVTLGQDIPLLIPGDKVLIGQESGTDLAAADMIGVFQVAQILNRTHSGIGTITFTYLSGGETISISGKGVCSTQWADYARKVYFEYLLGNQTLGVTFQGMTAGTPLDGDMGDFVNTSHPGGVSGAPQPNPWTQYCSLQNKTAVFLRMHYDSNYFKGGLPQISFLIHGKADIYDPRLGALSGISNTGTQIYALGTGYQAGAPGTEGQGDVLTLVQAGASGGQIYVNAVSSTGQITAFQVIAQGIGYSLSSTGLSVTGGHGSGAEFSISALTGAYGTTGFTNNAALCIADFLALAQDFGGYGCAYGTEIPLAQLESAANTCAEQVPLASGVDLTITNVTITTSGWALSPAPEILPPAPNNPGVWVNYATQQLVYWPVWPPSATNQSPSYMTLAAAVSGGYVTSATTGPTAITEDNFDCDGSFTLDMRRGEILENLLTSCAGRITFVSGQYVIWPGAYTSISFAIGSNPGGGIVSLPAFSQLAAGPIAWKPMVPSRDVYNGVKGTYISQAAKWMAADFPPYAQDTLHGYSGPVQFEGDANLAADGGDRRWLTIQLPFTISASRAQRIAKIELLRRRAWGTGTFIFNLMAYQITSLDLIEVLLPILGWSPTSELLEVLETRLRLIQGEGDAGPGLVYELDVKQTSSAIYAWSTTEELSPQGYQQPLIPGIGSLTFMSTENTPGMNVPYPLQPATALALPGDSLYPGPVVSGVDEAFANFGLGVSYGVDAQGNAYLNLLFGAVLPPNVLSAAIAPPQVLCQVGTAGALPPGTYLVAVSAIDTGTPPLNTALSMPLTVTIPSGASNGSIVVTVSWPNGANGGEVYMASGSKYNGFCFQGTMASGVTTFTITNCNQSTPGAPDSTLDHLAVAWKRIIHAGVWAQQVQAVTSTTITIGGSGMTANQWAGRTVSLLAKFNAASTYIILNMPVSASSASSGGFFTLTIGTNSLGTQLPNLTTLLSVGDLLVMRMHPTFTSTSFTDSLLANPYYPGGDTGVEVGNVVHVLTGADAGDIQTISAVGTNSSGIPCVYNLSQPWKTTPATGDIVIICEATWGAEHDTATLNSPSRSTISGTLCTLPIANLAGQQWLFIARTQNSDDDDGSDTYAPVREIYITGAGGSRFIGVPSSSSYTVYTELVTDGLVSFDTSLGSAIFDLLPGSQVPNQILTVAKQSASANGNVVIINCAQGDAFPIGIYTVSYPVTISGSTITGSGFTPTLNGTTVSLNGTEYIFTYVSPTSGTVIPV